MNRLGLGKTGEGVLMGTRRYGLFFAGLAFLLVGCAANQGDIKVLKEKVQIQQKQLLDLKARQEEHSIKLESLNNGFTILGSKAEENSLVIEDIQGQLRSPSAAPVKVRPMPKREPATPLPKSSPPPAAVSQPRPAPPSPAEGRRGSISSIDLYRSAMDSYGRGDYSGAVLHFQEFLANFSGHQLADNAQYWIGECYYAQKKFSEAEVEFGKVEKHYREGNKSAAALLKEVWP